MIELAAEYDDFAEDQLIGCVLAGADPSDIAIQPADFLQPRNEAIYRACLAVADSGRRPDPRSVAHAMGMDANRLPSGPLHLVNLAEHAIPANAASFAATVRTESERRGLREIALRIIAQIERDPADLAEDARGWLDAPAEAAAESHTVGELMPAFVERVEKGGEPGLTTPWPDLDWKLHGLHPGRLYTVGGRPGGGKSVVLANIGAHFALKHRAPVFFSTLEMPSHELLSRIVAAQAHISQTNLMTSQLSESDWQNLANKHADLSSMPMRISDRPHQTLRSIRTEARTMKRKGGLGLIVVDYLQLLTPPDRKLNRYQQIGDLTRGLKQLAMELEVPVLTASQLARPREGKNPKPTLSDLRESGDIEQDSDVVLLLHHQDEDDQWNIDVHVAKNRSGPKGPVSLTFDTTRARMRSVVRNPGLGAA